MLPHKVTILTRVVFCIQTCFKKQCEQQNVFYIDDDDDDEPSRLQRIKNPAKKSPKSVVKWIDEPIGFSSDKKEKFYDSVEINQNRIQTGDFVLVRSDDPLTPGKSEKFNLRPSRVVQFPIYLQVTTIWCCRVCILVWTDLKNVYFSIIISQNCFYQMFFNTFCHHILIFRPNPVSHKLSEPWRGRKGVFRSGVHYSQSKN